MQKTKLRQLAITYGGTTESSNNRIRGGQDIVVMLLCDTRIECLRASRLLLDHNLT